MVLAMAVLANIEDPCYTSTQSIELYQALHYSIIYAFFFSFLIPTPTFLKASY